MRWIVRLLGLVVLLLALAVGALFLLPAERIADLVNARLSTATGRELALSGRLRPTFWPLLGLSTGAVTLSNADWSDAGPMLRAEGLSVGLAPGALLSGEIRIARLSLSSPEILLERAADGRANWQFPAGDDTAGAAAREGSSTSALAIEAATLSGGSVTFVDHGAGTRISLTGLSGRVELPEAGGVLTAALSGRMNGTEVSLAARIEETAALLAGNDSAVTVDLSAGDARAGFEGTASTAPAASGRLTAELPEPGALFAILGQDEEALPPALGAAARLAADLSYTPEGGVALDGLEAGLGDLTASGALNLALMADPRPRLSGTLALGDINAAALAGTPASGGGGTASPAAGWPTTPLDLSPLALLDAELTLSAASVTLPETRIGRVEAGLTLEDRRLVVQLARLDAFSGGVTGDVVVNGRGTPSASADLAMSGMDLRPLLSDLAGITRLTGSAAGNIDVIASGASVDAMIRSLDGSGRIDFGQGEIIGLDLAGIVRNLDLSYVGEGRRTVYDSLTGSFTITDGVLSNDDLRLETPLVLARASGTVSLGPRTLDYRLVPELRAGGEEAKALRLPIRFSGSWDRPGIGLDLEGAAEARLEDAAEKAGDAARQKLRDEIGAGEGQSTEDAVRDKIEEEVGRGLQNLLGR